MTRLHLVRHGPTHAKTMIGWTDLPADLSDTGKLARLSAALPDRALMQSSDLIRTCATADALTAPGRQRLAHNPALRELHFGQWENRSFDEINADEPQAISDFWERPGDSPATGGESWNDISGRVHQAADALLGQADDIILVVHFGVILSLLQRARAVGPTEIFAQKIEPLSLTRLCWDGQGWHEELANHEP